METNNMSGYYNNCKNIDGSCSKMLQSMKRLQLEQSPTQSFISQGDKSPSTRDHVISLNSTPSSRLKSPGKRIDIESTYYKTVEKKLMSNKSKCKYRKGTPRLNESTNTRNSYLNTPLTSSTSFRQSRQSLLSRASKVTSTTKKVTIVL